MTDAKQNLIAAIAEQNFRSTASLADAHLASAIEALIDERIRQLFPPAPPLPKGNDAVMPVSFDDIQESIAKLDTGDKP